MHYLPFWLNVTTQQGEAVRGEGDMPEQELRADPMPVRVSQESEQNRWKTSRGKRKRLLDPRQNKITSFFQVKDEKKTKELESSDNLNLESAATAVAGGTAENIADEAVRDLQELTKNDSEKPTKHL